MVVYKILRTIGSVYIDDGGKPVNGYSVYFNVAEFGANHSVSVPDIKPETVDNAIMTIIERLRLLQGLGTGE